MNYYFYFINQTKSNKQISIHLHTKRNNFMVDEKRDRSIQWNILFFSSFFVGEGVLFCLFFFFFSLNFFFSHFFLLNLFFSFFFFHFVFVGLDCNKQNVGKWFWRCSKQRRRRRLHCWSGCWWENGDVCDNQHWL